MDWNNSRKLKTPAIIFSLYVYIFQANIDILCLLLRLQYLTGFFFLNTYQENQNCLAYIKSSIYL